AAYLTSSKNREVFRRYQPVAGITYTSSLGRLFLSNCLNTEYQKKVISKLDELAKELGSEFDSKSPNWWAQHNPIREFVNEINETYTEQKEGLEELGEYPYSYPVSAPIKRMRYTLYKIESDPFIPKHIRKLVSELLEKRISTLSEIYYDAFDSYFKSLLKSEKMLMTDGTDQDFDKFHNKIIDKLNKSGCGISEIERQVHEIRLSIQFYFESFNPIK
ncbi:MAG: hypothetical protein KAI50_11955, partial [Desulfobacterales bacterium]|nr:hypothetical protein [Desulfobacterales bacterium]